MELENKKRGLLLQQHKHKRGYNGIQELTDEFKQIKLDQDHFMVSVVVNLNYCAIDIQRKQQIV